MSEASITADRTCAPAGSGNHIEVEIRSAGSELVRLELSGPASFDEHRSLRRIEFEARGNSHFVRIHSNGRPGRVILRCGRNRHILRFEPASFLQGLVYDWMPTLGLSLVLALVLRSFAFASYYVPSPSMQGTLQPGDKFIAEKFSTKVLHRSPERGEIVIFQHPDHPKETWVKRVIGMPGDLVEIRAGRVWINNEPLQEDYIEDEVMFDYGPVSVPAGQYFVLGDNRDNSLDSRYWGYLPQEYIEGSPVLIFWPPQNARSLNSARQGADVE